MLDLTRALTEAAETATSPRPALDAAPLRPRIRRRRTLRATGLGAAALGAAAVVALGTMTLAGHPLTLDIPPATSTSGWPPASTVPGVPGCGDPLPEADGEIGTGLSTSITYDLGQRLTTGTTVSLASTLYLEGIEERTLLEVTPLTTPVVVLLGADGTVVATGGGVPVEAEVSAGSSGTSITRSTLVPLVACDGSGSLAPGQYMAFALWELGQGPGTTTVGSGWTLDRGGDDPIVVTGSGAALMVAESFGGFAAPLPGRGETTGGLDATTGPEGITTATSVDVVRSDGTTPDLLHLELAVTSAGPALGIGDHKNELAWVIAQDGRVLCTDRAELDTDGPGTWPAGGTRTLSVTAGLAGCGVDDTLAAGTYQVWALGNLWADLSPATGGTEVLSVVAAPVTLVLDS